MNQLYLFFLVAASYSLPLDSWAQLSTPEKLLPVTPNMTGTWGFSTMSYVKIYRTSKTDVTKKTVSVHCNSCPEITFITDGTGCIKSENGTETLSTFKWKMTGRKLVFSNDKNVKKDDIKLDDGSYQVISHNKIMGMTAIELVDSKNTKQLLVKAN